LDEWDVNNSYHEDVPSYLHYSIEWKITVNSRAISKDTEQDLVLAPSSYWHIVLKSKLEQLLERKLAPNRRVCCDDTDVKVSVTGSRKRCLTRRFEKTTIDWPVVEKQLIDWGQLLRSGKKLRVDISFNYKDSSPDSANSPKRGNGRGSSATKRMLAQRDAQLDEEQQTTGKPSAWNEVYALMRCPGPPCDRGPHCWRDPFGKKHYPLTPRLLKALIKYVEDDNTLKSQDDVPQDIRQQLYDAEKERLERPSKATNAPTPQINITNVLPHPHQSSAGSTDDTTQASAARSLGKTSLDIPGFRDIAVKEYSKWQQSKVDDEEWKGDIQKACEEALKERLDLELLHADQDPEYFIKKGIKSGVARRFVGDIDTWVKRQKKS